MNELAAVVMIEKESASAPWNIIEVKSSTSVKDEHVSDVAIQAWVLRACGEKLRRCSVMFINNQCAFPKLDDLFSTEEVTKEVEAAIPSVPKLIAKLQALLKKPKAPTHDIGPHCSDPYECPYAEHCWDERGVVSPSIFELPGIGKKAWDYYEKGIISLTDKRLSGLKGKQARALDVVRTKAMWIDRPAIMNGIKDWKWPLYFLDFETIGSAIPRYAGIRPYQQIPFQFSCHVQDAPGGEVQHIEYLHDQPTDPRPAVAAALVQAIGPKGSIAAYNMSVEARAVEHLASVCPKQAAALKKMGDRFVDPLPVVRGSVYAPEFRGSFSIKAVAPALLGDEFAYGGLDVGEGQEAQVAFDQLISALTPSAEKEKLRTAMLAYCCQDTLAMIKLVEWLYQQVSE